MAYYYTDEKGNLQIGSSYPKDDTTETADYMSILNKGVDAVSSAGTDAVMKSVFDYDDDDFDYLNSDSTKSSSSSSVTGKTEVVDETTINTSSLSEDEQESLVNKIMTESMNGIECIPYQFMSTVDARLKNTGTNGTDESKLGRKYASKIMGRLPLLFLTPCFPKALADFSDEDKQSLINMILDGNTDEDLVNGSGRYYSVTFAYDEYYRYFNCMMAATAAFLGIYDTKIPTITGDKTKKIGEYDWTNELNDDLKTFFDAKENVVFYLDGFNSISESFTNEVTESSIASQINGVSDTAHELNFLLAGNDSVLAKIADNVTDAVDSVTTALSDVLGDLGGGIIGSLADNGVNSLANGGKIVFPQIWSNSSYSRTYTLDLKLRSPDHDSLSIYLNIIKPYCKILCMCLPRVMENEDHYNANSYMSPFLVKAFSKGMFNIDMGMITSLSVTKGAECQWNDDGLPTQIDISLDITDLYSSLAMSGFESTGLIGNPFKATKQIVKIVNNTAYMDFLANMAGLNVGQMAIGRRIQMFKYLAQTATTQYVSRKFTQFDQKISTVFASLYDTF
jgi:hypothetical protein